MDEFGLAVGRGRTQSVRLARGESPPHLLNCRDVLTSQDFVTLATWRISRKQPTDTFPWGYSKFETFGTLSVSIILGMFKAADGRHWPVLR